MATVASIADAINVQLLALDDVDFVSTDNFLPAIETRKVAALTLPFSMESTTRFISLGGYLFIHRIRTEFWVKHVQGKESETMAYAQDIGRKAVNRLIANDGTGYTLHRTEPFEFQVDQGMLQDNSLPWLVCVLVTPVQDDGCDPVEE